MPHLIDGVSHISAEELNEIVTKQDSPIVVIDVREPEEYEAAHIPGLSLIPMGDIIDLLDDFDPAREYVFVCRSGRRSLEVAKFFAANGFRKVHNFEGGMLRWQEQGLTTATGLESAAAGE